MSHSLSVSTWFLRSKTHTKVDLLLKRFRPKCKGVFRAWAGWWWVAWKSVCIRLYINLYYVMNYKAKAVRHKKINLNIFVYLYRQSRLSLILKITLSVPAALSKCDRVILEMVLVWWQNTWLPLPKKEILKKMCIMVTVPGTISWPADHLLTEQSQGGNAKPADSHSGLFWVSGSYTRSSGGEALFVSIHHLAPEPATNGRRSTWTELWRGPEVLNCSKAPVNWFKKRRPLLPLGVLTTPQLSNRPSVFIHPT